MATLDADKQLVSDLWLDQPDAHEQIDARQREGKLDEADAAQLHRFTDEGWTQIHLTDSEGLDARFDADVEQLWRDRPVDLAMAPKAGGRISFADASDEDRHIGYRITDPHSHSPTARDLYLNPEIFRVVELILDQPAVAFQSLYFQYGSEQSLHRDPMFVVTTPASHLVASWIALEDITEDSGPLLYVPGSHRMPWFEFAPDTIAAPGDDKPMRAKWSEYRAQWLQDTGREAKPFTCKQGDVFIWHGALLHGGAKVTNPTATRKSFVVHYSSAANYKNRRATMKVKADVGDEEQWVGASGTTTDLLEQAGRTGIDNPLRHMEVAGQAKRRSRFRIGKS
jgi:ectoine hydroxylase-related dioxygenase (phytanoyl-CoA dioxygenase family)